MKRVDYGPYGKIEYCIFDPTGNITALVMTEVEAGDQPSAAAVIMDAEPAVEQVGFVSFKGDDDGVPVTLRMAGGEFCGNATMCAAALYLLMNGDADKAGSAEAGATADGCGGPAAAAGTRKVMVSVSGAAAPLEVRLMRTDSRAAEVSEEDPGSADLSSAAFEGAVTMPPALSIDEIVFNMEDPSESREGKSDKIPLDAIGFDPLPLVRMGGIDHIIIEEGSVFYGLKDNEVFAEVLLRKWCRQLDSDCLGLMFLDRPVANALYTLTPLVYVPGADTMFWENSCASGSAAAGMYLAAQAGSPADITFDEPAGRLRVESDPLAQITVLHGSVILEQ